MAEKPKNPPAFPVREIPLPGGFVASDTGMDLRDYFAAAALTGIIGAGKSPIRTMLDGPPTLGEVCYEIADQMLQERMKNV